MKQALLGRAGVQRQGDWQACASGSNNPATKCLAPARHAAPAGRWKAAVKKSQDPALSDHLRKW